jgi:hypothetical protein
VGGINPYWFLSLLSFLKFPLLSTALSIKQRAPTECLRAPPLGREGMAQNTPYWEITSELARGLKIQGGQDVNAPPVLPGAS